MKLRNSISHQIEQDGYFFSQFHSVFEQTGLTPQQFQSSLNYLIDHNLIKCQAVGLTDQIPIIRYKINDENYLKLFKINASKLAKNNRFKHLLRRVDIYHLFSIYDISRKVLKKFRIHHILIDFPSKKPRLKWLKVKALPYFHITSDKISEVDILENKSKNFDYVIINKCVDLHYKLDPKDWIHKKPPSLKKNTLLTKGIERAPKVFTTIDEHNILVTKHGLEAVERGYLYLSRYYHNKTTTKRQQRAFYAMDNWALEASKRE
ncbi:MAG TPA: hypothetical protein VJ599_00985 [Nitrososphaeraceae archaeon]|nr:hypothetical protein [Nitrososphaeraceae archaeon]